MVTILPIITTKMLIWICVRMGGCNLGFSPQTFQYWDTYFLRRPGGLVLSSIMSKDKCLVGFGENIPMSNSCQEGDQKRWTGQRNGT